MGPTYRATAASASAHLNAADAALANLERAYPMGLRTEGGHGPT